MNIRLEEISFIWNGRVGNPYHDEKGRFTFSPNGLGMKFLSTQEYYSKISSNGEGKQEYESRYMREVLDRAYNETIDIADPAERSSKERELVAKYSEEFNKTNSKLFDKKFDSAKKILDISHEGYLVVYGNSDVIDFNKSTPIPEETTKANLAKMTDKQKENLTSYTGEYGDSSYHSVNKFLRTGEGSSATAAAAKNISAALNNSTIGVSTQLYRGLEPEALGGKKLVTAINQLNMAINKGSIKDASKMLQTISELKDKTIVDKGCMSTSNVYDSKYANRGVLMVINAGKDTKGCDITSISKYGGAKDSFSERFGSTLSNENEVLLAPNTAIKINSLAVTKQGVVAFCDVVKQVNNNMEIIWLNGGKGSGNFGHVGRPGKVGGSGKGGSRKITSEERDAKILDLYNEFKAKKKEITNGAWVDETERDVFGNPDDPIATQEIIDKVNALEKDMQEQVSSVNADYYKGIGEYTEPGYYNIDGQVYEVVKDWRTNESGDVKQIMYPVDGPKTRENTFMVYDSDKNKMQKVAVEKAYLSIKSGGTMNGISRSEERIIKTYTYAGYQNTALREGKTLDEIPSAQKLANVIDRTNSAAGTYWRGFRTAKSAESLTSLKVGDVYEDRGFMSTDRDRKVAETFSDSKILLKVKSSGGFGKSLNIASYSMHFEENEELFNAGSKFKITNIERNAGYTIYTGEI